METAVLVIDMVNAYDHEDGARAAEHARERVPALARLLTRAREDDVPVIYVNDNFGEWQSEKGGLVEKALGCAYPDLVEPLVPQDGDTFVLKARHSAFFQTPLEYLLEDKEARRLVVCGQVTEQCVLYSALDAYVRHYGLVVPRDAVVPIDRELGEASIQLMERNMKAEVVDTGDDVRWR